MAKKNTPKKAAKKVASKKSTAKKVVTKKATVKKRPRKKVAKQQEKTQIIARVDVGFGNSLYMRGEGADLSWDKGVLLDNISAYEWSLALTQAKGDVTFKFLINDEIWAEGENLSVAQGGTSISSPVFVW